MQDTRQQILSLLQQQGSGTVNSIASDMSLSPATVRHHVTILQRDGLVNAERVRQSVGRPRLVYSLSSVGRETFPKKYDEFSTMMLTELSKMYGRDVINTLMQRIAEQKVADLNVDIVPLDPVERLQLLNQMFSGEGYISELTVEGNQAVLRQHTCPFQSIVKVHPEVCLLNNYIINGITDSAYVQGACIMKGDAFCSYVFDLTSTRKSDDEKLDNTPRP